VDESQPMYSLIAFAQNEDPKEDGFLHTYEVFNLKLNADLVTLSACETGLGKLSRGEGLIGLTRGFIYAGAPSVLVSLWSVDESTAALMKIFYQNLKSGMSKAEALRRAKLKLIDTQENGFSFAHPFLWAPFVLVGEAK
jgi:CHAT domain-containing protein